MPSLTVKLYVRDLKKSLESIKEIGFMHKRIKLEFESGVNIKRMPIDDKQIVGSILIEALNAIPKHVESLDLSNKNLREYLSSRSLSSPDSYAGVKDDIGNFLYLTRRFKQVYWGDDRLQILYLNFKKNKESGKVRGYLIGGSIFAALSGASYIGFLTLFFMSAAATIPAAGFLLAFGLGILGLLSAGIAAIFYLFSNPDVNNIPKTITSSTDYIKDFFYNTDLGVGQEIELTEIPSSKKMVQYPLRASGSENSAPSDLVQIGLFSAASVKNVPKPSSNPVIAANP